MKSWLRQNRKFLKIQFFENGFWDEFLLGWVLILKNGGTDVWKVILYLLYHFLTTWNILKIWTFQKIFRKKIFEIQNFNFEKI